jgi:hypothetical protein
MPGESAAVVAATEIDQSQRQEKTIMVTNITNRTLCSLIIAAILVGYVMPFVDLGLGA